MRGKRAVLAMKREGEEDERRRSKRTRNRGIKRKKRGRAEEVKREANGKF